jgi:hypothetical protein
MAFKFAYNLANRVGPPKNDPIATTTAITKGSFVKFTPATGVEAYDGTDADDCILGIAAVAHNGTTDDGVQMESYIPVYADVNDVYEFEPSTAMTLTGGSTTTAVIAGLLPATNSLWKDGYIKIVTCAADADLNGRMVKISDSTGGTGTLTLAETLPSVLAAGDTIYVYPGKLAIGEYGWDLISGNLEIDYDTNGGSAIILHDADPERKK